MKKAFKYLLFLLIIFVSFNVRALDTSNCDGVTTACAMCEYIVNEGTNTRVVFTVKSSSDGIVSYDSKSTSQYGTSSVYTDTVAGSNFYSKNTDKLTCPSILKTGIVSTGRGANFYASFTESKVGNVTLNGSVSLNESYNNDKNVTSGVDELHSCTYSDSKNNVSIEVQYNTTSMKYEGHGYTVSHSDFTVNDFQGGCPVGYLTCTTRGGYYCSLEKNNPGGGFTHEVTPTDTSDADSITIGEVNTPTSSLKENSTGEAVYDCEGLIGPNVLTFLQLILSLIMIVGPIIAVVLGMYDLFMAMAKGEEDDKKKAFKKLKSRLIATVLLLILPYIIKMLLTIVGRGNSICL